MPRNIRSVQDMLKGADHMQDAGWKFRDESSLSQEAPAAGEARARMRKEAEAALEGAETKKRKPAPQFEDRETEAWRDKYKKQEIEWPSVVETERGYRSAEGYREELEWKLFRLERLLHAAERRRGELFDRLNRGGLRTRGEWQNDPWIKERTVVEEEIRKLNEEIKIVRVKLKNYKKDFDVLAQKQVLERYRGTIEVEKSDPREGLAEEFDADLGRLSGEEWGRIKKKDKEGRRPHGRFTTLGSSQGKHGTGERPAQKPKYKTDKRVGASFISGRTEAGRILEKAADNEGDVGAEQYFTEEKPNPEIDRLSFRERLQAGWLDLGDLDWRGLTERHERDFDLSDKKDHELGRARRQYMENLHQALEVVTDRRHPDIGAAVREFTKLISDFYAKNQAVLSRGQDSWQLDQAIETAVKNFVERLIFKISLQTHLTEEAEPEENVRNFIKGLDSAADSEIYEMLKEFQGNQHLFAQTEALRAKLRDLAYQMTQEAKVQTELAERGKVGLMERARRKGIDGVELADLLPVYDGGKEIARDDRRVASLQDRLGIWQNPGEGRGEFKETINRLVSLARRFYTENFAMLQKRRYGFINPETEMKRFLQDVLYYNPIHYHSGEGGRDYRHLLGYFQDNVLKHFESYHDMMSWPADASLDRDEAREVDKFRGNLRSFLSDIDELMRQTYSFKEQKAA